MGGKVVAHALRATGAKVEVHDAHFAIDSPDVEWLPVVGQREWVLISKDKRIRRNHLERAALLHAGVRAFFLTSGNLGGAEMAKVLLRQLGRLERLARDEEAPFIAIVTRSQITLLR
jgi:PIN domain-containing protein